MWVSSIHLFLPSPLIYTVGFEWTTCGSPSCRKHVRGAHLWTSLTFYLGPHQSIYTVLFRFVSLRNCAGWVWCLAESLRYYAFLSDLMHYRCNRVYVPWVNKGVRRTEFIRNIISKSIEHLLNHIVVWYLWTRFQARQETRKRRASMLPNGVYSLRTWTHRDYGRLKYHSSSTYHSGFRGTSRDRIVGTAWQSIINASQQARATPCAPSSSVYHHSFI